MLQATPARPTPLDAWVLSDGKIGDEVQCFGILNAVADILPLTITRHVIAPRKPFAWLTPYGPMDPREAPHRAGSPIAPPFPSIAISAGRRTVPYLRGLKRFSNGRTFTIFVKDPYTGLKTADMLWIPQHDTLRGENVFVTLTPPHSFTPSRFALARANPDARLANLPTPRLAIVMGGSSVNYDFTRQDSANLCGIAMQALAQGLSVMVTPSRRTPEFAKIAMRETLREVISNGRAFFWDETGDNPYLAMLALTDFVLVTADSVNMVGEATASGAPVYIYEPSGTGHAKMTRYLDSLIKLGAVRRYQGQFERFSYPPQNSAPQIAADVLRRYKTFVKGT